LSRKTLLQCIRYIINSMSSQFPQVVPDQTSTSGKKEQVAEMFNNIAGKYDFLNHFLSLGIDKTWRKKAIREVATVSPSKILDVATGTGDMAIAAHAAIPGVTVTGVDIAAQMLEEGRKKLVVKELTKNITLELGDSESLPFPSGSFDAVMCAYGVRNFEHLENGLSEMQRVMREGGKLAILEFSRPATFPIKQLYTFYFRRILPVLGSIVSKHKTAYTYLPESVNAFPDGKNFCDILTKCGFKDAKARPLTLGVTTLYTATK
jgi:demethylmenaquinone methyltransferase / 2-methoxy-6-polyprenyl-1,4-benzoquinol methylase